MTQIWPRPFYPSHILAYLEAKCKYDFFYSKHEGFGKETIMNVKQQMDQMGKSGCVAVEPRYPCKTCGFVGGYLKNKI